MSSLFEAIHWAEVPLILSLQRFASPGLTLFFKGMSLLGEDVFYLLLLSALWAIAERAKVARIALLLLISFFLNSLFKQLLAQPRPFQFFGEISALGSASGQGIPSGHAQSSLLFWSLIAASFGGRWVRGLALGMIALIPLSRVYLGVHFPSDILGGWLLAGAILWWDRTRGAATVSLLNKLDPRSWVRLTGFLAALGLAVHPSETSAAALGALFGLVSGLVLDLRRSSPSRSPEAPQAADVGTRARSVVIAWTGAALLYVGLKALFPAQGEPAYLFFRFARYALLALWITAGVSSVLRFPPFRLPRVA